MITHKQKLEIEAGFLVIIAVVIGLIAVSIKNGTYQSPFNIISGASPASAPVKVIAPEIFLYSQISPNGEKMILMKKTQGVENATFDFSVSDGDGANEKLIFTKTLELSKNMSIPFNTWSPDNKYFFVQENSENNRNIFALKADGTQFAGGESYLDVTDLFAKRDTGNSFDEATGWASETLIIINTTNKKNEKGPSYWFEIPSKAIIQLSTEF